MAPLHPAAGEALPPKALMARSTPTPEELLTPRAVAEPQRVDELMTKSTPRQADPFDLPPPGGEAPTLPAKGQASSQPETPTGPVQPQ